MDNCPKCKVDFEFYLYVTYEPLEAGFRDICCPHCGLEFSEYDEDL